MAALAFWREAAMAVLLIGLLWYRGEAREAELELAIVENSLEECVENNDELKFALLGQETAIQEVVRVNDANRAEAERIAHETEQAAAEVEVLRQRLRSTETILESLETDDVEECTRLDEPMPGDFVRRLREQWPEVRPD